MIPPSFVQDLLSRVDVVEVVGRYVQLKKAGINHKGLCPFHGEKTPSFTVSATRQTYHCFGCGVHGNALGFLMAYSGMGFLDAVRDLAQQVGMAVPEDNRTPQEREKAAALKERQATLTDVLHKASDHYRKQLKGNKRAVDYLRGRGLTGEIALAFGLGYAADGWRGLASVFPRYDDPLLEESGLVIATGDTEADRKRYDRFRDRIMFPIRNVQGEVIGFGGRVLDKGEPKYLNSPETAVFHKGKELYGLHEARAGLRKRGYALVVEGYMDVVALAQLGFPNAVATLGTACSAEHVQKLFRFTETIVFSFDGDSAGRRAAGRALEASLPFATDTRSVRFLFLPPEHDPDSYVREHGAEAFEACVADAVPLSRQLIEAAREGCDTASAEGRARLLAQAKPMWLALPEGALKMQLLGDLAQAAALSTDDLNRLWQAQAQATGGRSRPPRDRTHEPDDYPPPDDSWSAESQDIDYSSFEPSETGAQRAPRQGGFQGGAGGQRRPWVDKPFFGKRKPPEEGVGLPRARTTSTEDLAVKFLLLHSEWWEQLDAGDLELLHELPAPHGALCAWMERHVQDNGPTAWAVWEVALRETEWARLVGRLVTEDALQEESQFTELRRVLDRMWVRQLERQQNELSQRAATDPAALAQYREVLQHKQKRLQALSLTPGPLT
ncbi:DNA primase [Rhizobacter sp. Root1221]|uniref:DNA primase n=1 Tax=Rhizobacter sp. Root1221 TaxID=1736433 RepID=UPI0007001D43|nr:DNA primase [Rhizobacter sp. Root1221]KQW03002.1 DNA primase [Rhizobacter sp. Root1221]